MSPLCLCSTATISDDEPGAKDLKSKYLYNTNYVIWIISVLKRKMAITRLIRSWQRYLTVWISIRERCLIIISSAARQRITWQIWNCFSMISCTEISMFIKRAGPPLRRPYGHGR